MRVLTILLTFIFYFSFMQAAFANRVHEQESFDRIFYLFLGAPYVYDHPTSDYLDVDWEPRPWPCNLFTITFADDSEERLLDLVAARMNDTSADDYMESVIREALNTSIQQFSSPARLRALQDIEINFLAQRQEYLSNDQAWRIDGLVSETENQIRDVNGMSPFVSYTDVVITNSNISGIFSRIEFALLAATSIRTSRNSGFKNILSRIIEEDLGEEISFILTNRSLTFPQFENDPDHVCYPVKRPNE